MVEELERADQQRRDLTADVAHELRTPIHIIQGNLEGIVDGVYEPSPEQIELLISETRQLSRLVEDLRTLSLAEAGQLPLKRDEIEIGELIRDVATSFSGQAESAELDLRIDIKQESGPLLIFGDAGRLDQVLSNLIANAISHTQPGGEIIFRAWKGPDGVRMQVSDNGRGIPPEDLPYIFERFWRGDSSRQSNSGLGLAISRQLVQSHGGDISVESQLNEGTTFTVDLPQ
jgi:two-component system OmpR family sensor kinase/two-component system sensor histidine kinase BaeS